MDKEYLFNCMCVGSVGPYNHRKEQDDIGGLLCHSLPYVLEARSPINPGTRLVASEPQRSSCLHLLHGWGYTHGGPHQLFTRALGI